MSEQLKSWIAFLEGDGDDGAGSPTMWLDKFRTQSLYEAMMYKVYVKRYDIIHFDGIEIDSREFEEKCFNDLLSAVVRAERDVVSDKEEKMFLVVGKTQEVSDEDHRQGRHVHFLDILGTANNIVDARDLFKQGRVGDLILLRDKEVSGQWRVLTGQQIIDLHAFRDGRPLSFEKNGETNRITELVQGYRAIIPTNFLTSHA